MIFETGLAAKLAVAGGLVSGVAVVLGTGTGNGQQAALSARPETIETICGYVSTSATAPSRGGADTESPESSSTPPARHGVSARTGLGRLGLDPEQQKNARVIVQTAASLQMPRHAAVIGIATALQESNLDAGAVGDHGTSFGIFQQKPTSGYGTRDEITDPRHAATAFFSRLHKVNGWQEMPLTQAAQTVQRSAHPDAYAKHEGRAERIVSAVGFPVSVPSAAAEPGTSKTPGRANEQLLQARILRAAAKGMPRTEALAALDRSLRHAGESVHDLEEQFDQASARLCRRLTTESGQTSSNIAANSSARGVVAVRAALKMQGVPYSWGGGGPNGPSRGIEHGANMIGFDCSGLAEYAWAQAGVRIGGHTSQQWQSGVRVPRNRLQPGDLLFFATNPSNPATIHHVGINIDGKRMIHAPHTGDHVRVVVWAGLANREQEYIGAIRPQQ